MFLTLFLVLCIIIIICCTCQAVAKVPVHPGSLPVFGHVFALATSRDFFKFFVLDTAKFGNDNGGVTVMKPPLLTLAPLYFILNLEDAQYILERCLDKMFVYKLVSHYGANKFFTAEVPIWKRRRNILSKALKPSIFNSYVGILNEGADLLTQTMADKAGNGYMNMKDMARINTLQTATIINLGYKIDVDSELMIAIQNLLTTLMKRLKNIYLYPDFIFKYSQLKKTQDKSLNFIEMKLKMIIEESVKRYKDAKDNSMLNSEAPKFRSTLDIILETTMTDQGLDCSFHDLADLMKITTFAQADTSYRQITNLLICIGSYPQIQEKVYQEIINVIGDEQVVTKEHLQKMVYIDAVVKETLRYLPVAPLVGRQSDKELKLSNVTIPPGGAFVVHLWSINRNTKYWGPDAKEFKPERWLNPETYNPEAFLSFSLGKRNCMGKSFAMMTMKITLVHVCKKFRLTADLSKIRFHYFGLIQPYGREQLKIELR